MTASVHLVVLIHGLWGSPNHLSVAQEELEKAWSGDENGQKVSQDVDGPSDDPIITSKIQNEDKENGELVIMIAGGMTSQLTYDGVDVCASRVAFEVDQKIKELEGEGKKVDKFSVMGYSLGGLVARYLVGLLHSRQPSFFDKHHPVSFSTISTPHYGIPKYNTLLSTVLCWLGARVMSRSGEQLYVVDNYSDEDQRPLLEIMADPRSIFYQGLERFDKLEIYASAINDNSVPYPTAAIESVDHFAQWEELGISVDSDEDGIIQSWTPTDNGSTAEDEDDKNENKNRKKGASGFRMRLGTLPPVLRYRFPFNYIILLLFPIMLPLIIILILTRQSLDTTRSKRRLQLLSQTSSSGSSSSQVPSSSGLSIQALRDGIRRIERSLESDLVENQELLDSPALHSHYPIGDGIAKDRGGESGTDLKIILKDSQMRMCYWLNQLPLEKYLTWWPEITNAHATAIVRDSHKFPVHERGRGLIKLWARNLLDKPKQ
ncbi:lipid particle protein [Kwoniella mangroviensis CBS 10435]|uniref:Lipid particle protein n=1 Tax=Kwoniella mangroviensis CBS 10435 TaxID=1331196 RepID=A0A1B9ITT0_9TREE|nr:lipid particle protein [Kwoniella mangroviensis CBS 10435]